MIEWWRPLGKNRLTGDYSTIFQPSQSAICGPDAVGQSQFGRSKKYVVQTALPAAERCILMTTDPGDLVFDFAGCPALRLFPRR